MAYCLYQAGTQFLAPHRNNQIAPYLPIRVSTAFLSFGLRTRKQDNQNTHPSPAIRTAKTIFFHPLRVDHGKNFNPHSPRVCRGRRPAAKGGMASHLREIINRSCLPSVRGMHPTFGTRVGFGENRNRIPPQCGAPWTSPPTNTKVEKQKNNRISRNQDGEKRLCPSPPRGSRQEHPPTFPAGL